MAQKTETKNSLQQAHNTEQRQKKQKQAAKYSIKKANRILAWAIGIAIALLPLIVSCTAIFLHSGNANVIQLYETFIEDFMNSGSFLWVSITLLAVSFVDLLLYGFRKKLSDQVKFGCRIFIFLIAAIGILAMFTYFENIATPINSSRMLFISVGSFILFAAASGFISFKIVQEG